MTQSAAPTQIRHQAGAYILTLNALPAGHYSVHVEHASTGKEIDGLRTTWPTFEQAIASMRNAYRHFATGGTIAPGACGGVTLVRPKTEVAPTEVKLAPAAKGTATKITDAGVRVLDDALHQGGHIKRGGHDGEATEPQLKALAKRGLLTLDIQLHGRRKYTAGGTITRAGRVAHLRATGGHLLTYQLAA